MFIRELIVEGTHEGPDAARDLLTRPENSLASIARLLEVSRSTLYKHVPELSGGRTQLQGTT